MLVVMAEIGVVLGMKKIAVVDTMFSRGDMGRVAVEALQKNSVEKNWQLKIVRLTVPGIKDIPVAMLSLLEQGCSAGIALGMPGSAQIDKQCAHEASLGIQQAQLIARKPVLEVFVHEDEARGDEELASIMRDRAEKHALNLLWLLFAPEGIAMRAGSGERQGRENAKKINL